MTATQPFQSTAARPADEDLRTVVAPLSRGCPSATNALLAAAMFAVGVGVVIWRRPDAVTYPQFWAEDGHVWFADAYNMGLASLSRSYAGYLQTLPRLVALPAAHLTLVHAALLFNLVGISIQAAPAAFLMSRRFEHVAPRAWVRALVGLLYLLIPSFELNATITNAQWHLFILAIMVLVARPPSRWWSRVFDAAAVTMSCLTGPFVVLLLPAAAARVLLSGRQKGWYVALGSGAAVSLALQVWAVLHSHRDTTANLGAGIKNLFYLVADRVVLAGSFSEEGHTYVFTEGRPHGAAIAGVVTGLAALVVAYVLFSSSWPIRIFVIACFAVTALGMLSPLASSTSASAWTVMATTAAGERYFLSAEVAWLVCVVWAISRITLRGARYGLAALTGIILASGVIREPQYAAYTDFHPATYDAALRAAAPGTAIIVPINPTWQVTLVRHR